MNICFNAVQFPIFVFESDLGLSAIRSLIVGGGPAVTTGDEYTVVRYVEQCKETIAPVGKHLEPGFPLKHPATGSIARLHNTGTEPAVPQTYSGHLGSE